MTRRPNFRKAVRNAKVSGRMFGETFASIGAEARADAAWQNRLRMIAKYEQLGLPGYPMSMSNMELAEALKDKESTQ